MLWQLRVTVDLTHCPFIDQCYGKCKLVWIKEPVDNKEKGAGAGAVWLADVVTHPPISQLDSVAYLLLVEMLHLHGDVFIQQISGCPHKWTCGRDCCGSCRAERTHGSHGPHDAALLEVYKCWFRHVITLITDCQAFSVLEMGSCGRLQQDVFSWFVRGGLRRSKNPPNYRK